MSKHSMDYRMQVCGWPRGCFSEDGTQLYTPQELERIAQADDHSCPAGVCIAARGDHLTGVDARALAHARALEAETTARLAVLTQGGRHNHPQQQPETKRLPDTAGAQERGGEWMKIGGAEIRQEAPAVKISLWDWITHR